MPSNRSPRNHTHVCSCSGPVYAPVEQGPSLGADVLSLETGDMADYFPSTSLLHKIYRTASLRMRARLGGGRS